MPKSNCYFAWHTSWYVDNHQFLYNYWIKYQHLEDACVYGYDDDDINDEIDSSVCLQNTKPLQSLDFINNKQSRI